MNQAQRASLQHRLKRRELWVSLWLTRLLGLLQGIYGDERDGVLRNFIDQALKAFAQCLMGIFLCHASLGLKVHAARGFNDPRKSDAFSMRAVFGGALRRAFRAKSLKERLEKIRRALERREILIANLARRLQRGMTRRANAHTRVLVVENIGVKNAGAADAVLVSALCARPIQCADTS